MKKNLILIVLGAVSLCAAFAQKSAEKVLIAYFSHSGNTRTIAREIHAQTGGDFFEIKATHTYPADYDAVLEVAKREQTAKARPTLSGSLPDMDSYDVVFLGFPNWWYDMPMAVYTFAESFDFSGKTVIPFCTHGGSGFSNSMATLRNLLTGARVLEGLAIYKSRVSGAKNEVTRWLRSLGR